MNRKLKTAILIVFDLVAFFMAWAVAIVCSGKNLLELLTSDWIYLAVGALLFVIMNAVFKVYGILMRYASFTDGLRIIASSAVVGIYSVIVCVVLQAGVFESGAIILTGVLLLVTVASRFFVRFIDTLNSKKRRTKVKAKIRVMVVGAGDAGNMLIREMKSSDKFNMTPVCAIDDDESKINSFINGVLVVGNTQSIKENAEKYEVEQIIIAMPSAKKKDVSRIVLECQKTNCLTKILPGIYQLANGNVSIAKIKPVSVTDLLGREQVEVNLNEIMGYIEGKTVLVTGGGGSIGSELCRQIAQHNPKELIILDIYENNAYDIQQELARKLPNLKLTVLIASVRDKTKVDEVFNKYKPQIVFHAAAHKHVPLMEVSPNEAVKNNVGGTLNVATASGKNNVERFILISTDKAVNPTNVMGATKRICEMIIQTLNKKYKTEYVAVRFGNVLGSNGSVIPLFKKLIEEGGPITVTHKDIVRYFMTIPEAVSLVLQAGAYANGGEIFVLDMGEPVRIYDLAVNMIKLSGLTPFEDIDVKITGLRPGEKLYEERLMEEEGLVKTANEKISIGKPLDIDEKTLFEKIDALILKAKDEADDMKDLVHDLVPTYVIDRR